MKRINLLACLIPAIIFIECKKEKIIIEKENKSSFLDSAFQYLKETLTDKDFSELNVASAQVLSYHNKNIGVKVFPKGSTAGDKFILLNQKDGYFIGNQVIITGMETLISKDHNGTIKLQALNKKLSTKFYVQNNYVITIEKTDVNDKIISANDISDTNFINIHRPSETSLEAAVQKYLLQEVVITAYVDGNSYDYWSLFYLSNQMESYDGLYTSSGGYGSGGDGYSSGGGSTPTGNSNSNVTAAPKFNSPDKPLADLKKEVACFTNTTASTYNVLINVNQPKPNTRDIINAFSSFPAGHTYLTLEQHNSDGTSVIRNIGFYPANYAKPGSAVDESIFGDDSDTQFDISLKFSVSGGEFLRVINTLTNQQSKNYDLNYFNCTNSSIEALNSINIHLPSTRSKDMLFQGNSPAGLGEDLRKLDLNTFSAANGSRKIVRTASNFNDRKPAAKKGTC